jgi:hypothetical protein
VKATVVSQPIVASVSSSGGISAAVVQSPAVSSTASGGVGPQGPPGPTGVVSIGNAQDVTLTNLSNNDLLRYSSSASRWVNVNQSVITDGGNFLVFLALVCVSQGGF